MISYQSLLLSTIVLNDIPVLLYQSSIISIYLLAILYGCDMFVSCCYGHLLV